MKPVIKIAVVSDIVCPWCYIGKRRLEQAIQQTVDQFTFEIAYYPFELNPEMPTEGVDQEQYLSTKFGSREAFQKITENVTSIARSEGLEFDFSKQKVSPNTRAAHRLILFANHEGKQQQIVEALFKAYFTQGIDLSKKENLLSIAVQAGLDHDRTDLFLQSTVGDAEVIQAEKDLQNMGIGAVPFYILNERYGISGAQSPETFIAAFNNVTLSPNKTGETCDTDIQKC